MWLTHFWHSWSQFFIFAWDVTAGGILRTGVLICLVEQVAIISSYRIVFKGGLMPKCLLSPRQIIDLLPEASFDDWGISCKIALRWMSLDLTEDKSTLVQVMAWCRQATSHYLRQCWPRSMSPYGVIRPQWVIYHPAVLFSRVDYCQSVSCVRDRLLICLV